MKPKECSFPAADDGIRCELLGLLVEQQLVTEGVGEGMKLEDGSSAADDDNDGVRYELLGLRPARSYMVLLKQ